MKRQAGILLPLYSLPSKYGCGTLGKEAYNFIDWLSAAGQSVWQMLPIGHTADNSPYRCLSSFAGNPYFVDLDILAEEGLLEAEDFKDIGWGKKSSRIDYKKLGETRFTVLKKAWSRGKSNPAFQCFKAENASWLPGYSLYMAAKDHFDGACWTDWPDYSLSRREPDTAAYYSELLKDDIDFYSFVQFEFFSQWDRLKAYAKEKGVQLIGDIPVYVPLDSVDVWTEPWFFQLDSENRPAASSGVPPDYFNEKGQVWNNPLYKWDVMKSDGYGWWIRRIGAALRFFDVVRIDHFRGFDSYWSVPAGSEDASEGHWEKGPGMDFVGVITSWFGGQHFIAEDLGILGDSVRKLLKDSGLPGMKVLQFAFNPEDKSAYLPHNCIENSICFTGTHDNNTLMGWLKEAPKKEQDFAKKYLNLTEDEGFNWGIIRGGMASASYLFMAQLQDYLGLGSDCRTNIPGETDGMWQWRADRKLLTKALAAKIRRLTEMYGRI